MQARSANRGGRFPVRRALSILVVGCVCALAAIVAGRLGVRLVLGNTIDTARQRVHAETQALFTAVSTGLRDDAVALGRPDTVDAANRGETDAIRELFDGVAARLGDNTDDTRAITIYGSSNQPLAWTGHPSDLPADRLSGGEAWFFTQGALGLRLVYAAPVLDAGGRRIGTVTAEQQIDVTVESNEPGDFMLASTRTPVAIELPFESARTVAEPDRVDIVAPNGTRLLVASVAAADVVRTERRWNRTAVSLAAVCGGLTALLLSGPLLTWRQRARTGRVDTVVLLSCAVAIVAARALFRLASPADYTTWELFSGSAYASPTAAPLLSSPFDFFLTALAGAALLLVSLAAVEACRVRRAMHRIVPDTPIRRLAFVVTHLAAGALVLTLVVAHRTFVSDTIANTALDLLQFSLHPWNTARLALQVGMVTWHLVAVGFGILVLRLASVPWRVPRRTPRVVFGTIAMWMLPWLLWLGAGGSEVRPVSSLAPLAAIVGIASFAPWLTARYRNGSQAFRLFLGGLAVIVPALACYPVVFSQVSVAKQDLVETRYAPQAINQRQTVQRVLQDSLAQLDAQPALETLVATPAGPEDTDASTERAFQLWRATGLAQYPITSSVELFGGDGRLVSRFAFNLPDDLTTTPRADEDQCAWSIYEEVSPFFAEERRVLHAGRAVCVAGPRGNIVVGAIVVHAILDYSNLPFIASQNPYVALLRPGDISDESLFGRDLEYAVYGWSGRPVYASTGTAWQLTSGTLADVATSRRPLWTTLSRDDAPYSVYLLNDRGGIYALGFPRLSALGHLVNLAEVTVLGCVAYLLLVSGELVLGAVGGRGGTGRALFREIRASFYRKLFLAFVAASVVPVVALALLTRNYIADQLRTGVEQEAVRTVASARRVVEDLVAPRTTSGRQVIDDNLMVWVSRLIDQDVNIFRGPRLQATSERNLFASGVLAARTPADVYRAITINRDATAIITDRIGRQTYLVAATPLVTRQGDGLLTVPLTLRQQDIESQIDTLNRLVLLGALLFILAGAGLGYSMAERIADPVNRLTRATRRIARGELSVRIAATSSDELRRLVHDFNRMAADLETQRDELERTHRLAAWAEMARQVAHEIKNPLTPIQLNAEHLRRVHADRGRPLSPILEECVGNILTQVSLLRTIASEFSNFASSPVVNRTPTAIGDLVREIVGPYQSALQEKVVVTVHVAEGLPAVLVDRTLFSRALTNIVENALHAMPAGGTLAVTVEPDDGRVIVRVVDTGVGMTEDALARAFEPYFSTKVTGTGLGLPIAKRNVELSGGAIEMRSRVNEGTTVTLALPAVT